MSNARIGMYDPKVTAWEDEDRTLNTLDFEEGDVVVNIFMPVDDQSAEVLLDRIERGVTTMRGKIKARHARSLSTRGEGEPGLPARISADDGEVL